MELTDQLCVSLGFPVYGVLEPLYEPLQVRDTRFERRQTIIACAGGRAPVLSLCALPRAAELADSCEQSLTVTHDHRPHDRLDGRGA